MTVATSIIDGTQIDDAILAVIAGAVALTTLAACARKTPVRQIGRGIGWVFGRLVGEPIAAWYEHNFREHAEPIVVVAVERAVERAIEPVKAEVGELRTELRTHITDEAKADVKSKEWQAGVDLALRNIQQGTADRAVRDREGG